MVEEISGMLALYPDEEVERASRCRGHQQKVIASRHEFDTCPLSSTDSHSSPAIAAMPASAGIRGGYNKTAPAAGRCLPVAGAALVSSSDVGHDLAWRVRDERKRHPFRERQERILDDALELSAPTTLSSWTRGTAALLTAPPASPSMSARI